MLIKMARNKMDISLVVIVSLVLKQAIALGTTISIETCSKHQYLEDGVCKTCEMCPAGHQPKEYCGYGERHINYGCQVCPEGTYSLRSDYNICVQCRPCEDWNSEIAQECSAESDQVCGACFEDFFRPFKSDGSLDDECHPCDVAPRGTAQCEKEPDVMWKNITFVLVAISSVCLLALVILISLFVRRGQRRKKNDKAKGGRKADGPDLVIAETRESLLQSSGSSRNSQVSEDSRLDVEHRVEIGQGMFPANSISNPVDRSPKSVPSTYVSEISGVKNDATRHLSMPQSMSRQTVSDSAYSNMPTAEFVESAPHSHNSQSPSNLSTGRYDDLHPSQIEGHFPRPNANSPQSFRIPSRSRQRPQAVPSSSSENLLLNADRDSREVEGSRTQVNTDFFDVEPFDTRSVTEETKPHKIGSFN